MSLVNLADISLDQSFQPRVKLHAATVEKYVRDYEDGVDLPPVTLGRLEGDERSLLYMVDGWHRAKARGVIGLVDVPAVIQTFESRAELLKAACRANVVHGLRLSKPDLMRAIQLLDQNIGRRAFKAMFAKDLAATLGVSDKTASKLREQHLNPPAEKVSTAVENGPDQAAFGKWIAAHLKSATPVVTDGSVTWSASVRESVSGAVLEALTQSLGFAPGMLTVTISADTAADQPDAPEATPVPQLGQSSEQAQPAAAAADGGGLSDAEVAVEIEKLAAGDLAYHIVQLLDELGLPECRQEAAAAAAQLCQSKLAENKSWAEASNKKHWRRFKKMLNMSPEINRQFTKRVTELYAATA